MSQCVNERVHVFLYELWERTNNAFVRDCGCTCCVNSSCQCETAKCHLCAGEVRVRSLMLRRVHACVHPHCTHSTYRALPALSSQVPQHVEVVAVSGCSENAIR